ncbi:MAG: PorT family protein [Flavobacteriaceae bacterium]|nr:PorT family protein [Flavobacteriaceae bacterium]
MTLIRLSTVLALFCFYFGSAQEYALGVRGGFNNFTIGDINSRGGSIAQGRPDELFSPKKEMGYQLGGYLNVAFGKLFVQPEINYLRAKNRYEFPDQDSKWNSSRIDIPLLAGYNIYKPVSIYAGPIFNFYNYTKLEGVQVTSFSDGGPDLEESTVNFVIGAMLRWKRFGVDLRYEIGSNETEEELLDIIRSTYGVNLADLRSYKPNVISLSFTVDIFRTDNDDIGGFFSGLFKNNNKCYCPY